MPFNLSHLLLATLLASLIFVGWSYLSLSSQFSELSDSHRQALLQLQQLQKNYSHLQSQYLAAQQSFLQQMLEANRTIDKLSFELNQSRQKASELSQELEQKEHLLKAQIRQLEQLKEEFSSMEKNISSSIEWFRQNAAFREEHGEKAKVYLKRVLEDCVDGQELNLACMSYLMENAAFAVHYRIDIESVGKEDFLQSVKQTIDSGWGDCEDYSLLFKAALNSLKQTQPNLKIVGWQRAESGIFYIYPKESIVLKDPYTSYWYYPNARKAYLGELGASNFFVVCFDTMGTYGHCTVAISEKPVLSINEVFSLAGARNFEPQNGEFLGIIGDGRSDVELEIGDKEFYFDYDICSLEECPTLSPYKIRLIITDSDLFKFYNGKWTSYGDYQAKIKQLLKNL
ncbi:MAG: hypothetical protein N3G80_01675 [Candidatus Micrarchaeota archaeon]|nr:hypothetical protein [Candidatus Micrarchaeota archaeon]